MNSMKPKAELRIFAVIVRNFLKLSPAGRAWVLSRIAQDDALLRSQSR